MSGRRTNLSRLSLLVLILVLPGAVRAEVHLPAIISDNMVLQVWSAHVFAQALYTWRNVQIYSGGFISGIVFNQTEANLVYVRTDIGGAYRLDNATNRWTPLLDSISWDDWNLTGVVSIATDPVNPNNVYIAAGTYTNEWASQNGAILRSTDRGATWQRPMLPFTLGGNMLGRGPGERLVVDANHNSLSISARRVATASGEVKTRASRGPK